MAERWHSQLLWQAYVTCLCIKMCRLMCDKLRFGGKWLKIDFTQKLVYFFWNNLYSGHRLRLLVIESRYCRADDVNNISAIVCGPLTVAASWRIVNTWSTLWSFIFSAQTIYERYIWLPCLMICTLQTEYDRFGQNWQQFWFLLCHVLHFCPASHCSVSGIFLEITGYCVLTVLYLLLKAEFMSMHFGCSRFVALLEMLAKLQQKMHQVSEHPDKGHSSITF